MVKKVSRTYANQMTLSRNLRKCIASFFRTKFQMESNHSKMKLHFQTSSFFFRYYWANYADSMFIHCFYHP